MKYENVVDVKVGDLWKLNRYVYMITKVSYGLCTLVDIKTFEEYSDYPTERFSHQTVNNWELISRAK